MPTTIVLTVLFFICAPYFALTAGLYRRPTALLLMGIGLSAGAAYLKYFIMASKVALAKEWRPEHFDLAAAFLDAALIGLAGGLIGSAFLIKLQKLHAQDLALHQERLEEAARRLHEAERDDEELRLVARSLSNEEFSRRLQQVRWRAVIAQLDKNEAERAHRRAHSSGL